MEAIREARKAILVTLTVSAVWLLTAGAVRQDLSTRKLIEDMGAWALLTDSLNKAYAADRTAMGIYDYLGSFDPVPVGGKVAQYRQGVFDNRGNESFEIHDLILAPAWQPGVQIAFSLQRIQAPSGLTLFRILCDDPAIASADYMAALRGDGRVTVHPGLHPVPGTFRAYENALQQGGRLIGPNRRAEVENLLRSRGWTGQGAEAIRSDDPVVAKLILEVQGKRHTVAGLPVSAALLPVAVGMLLAMAAFNLLGPVLRLCSGAEDLDQEVWTFLNRPESSIAPLVALIQVLAAALCIALPLLVAIGLTGFYPLVSGWQQVLVLFASLGAGLSALMMLAFFRICLRL
jgi:hypothetical protein